MLIGATVLNLVTFAPPWMVTLPGLRFRQAFAMTQASTALSIIAPGGAAVGMAGSWGMLRAWGFRTADVARAITLTGVWNQLANLVFPVVALFLLKVNGGETALLGTAAFVGVVVLGVVVAAARARPLLGRARARCRRRRGAVRLVGEGEGPAQAGGVGRGELRALPQRGGRSAGAALARAHARDVRRQPDGLPPARAQPPCRRRARLRGRRRRDLRRVGARPHHRGDPDHARVASASSSSA